MAAVIAEMGRARRRARTWPVPAAAAGRADRGPRSEHRSQIARGVCLENPVNRTVPLFARDMERSMKVKEPDLHTVRVTRGDNTHTVRGVAIEIEVREPASRFPGNRAKIKGAAHTISKFSRKSSQNPAADFHLLISKARLRTVLSTPPRWAGRVSDTYTSGANHPMSPGAWS